MTDAIQAAWLNAIPAAILLYRPDSVLFANRAAADLVGRSAAELIGLRLEDMLDGETLKTSAGRLPVSVTDEEIDYQGQPTRLMTLLRRDSTDLHRAAIESSADNFYIGRIQRDAEGKFADLLITDANESGVKQTGLERVHLLDHSILEIAPNVIRDDLTGFGRLVETGQAYSSELHIEGLVVKNGWYDVQVIPLTDDHVAIFLRDISVRKESEQIAQRLAGELEQQARLLDEILSATPDGFILFDRAGHYLFVNRSGLENSGLEVHQVVGKTWRELGFPEEAGLIFEQRLEEVFTTGKSITYEEKFPTNSGLHDFMTTLTPIHDQDGQVIFMLNTIRDITERKQAELEQQKLAGELEQQARIFDEVLSTTPDNFLMIDLDGKFLYASPSSLQNVALSTQQVVGKSWGELGFPEETGKQADEMIRQVVRTGTSSMVESPFPTVTGLRQFESIYSPLHDKSGRVVSVVITNHDITERKRMEEELRENQKLLTSIYETALAGIALVDQEGNYVQVNQTYAGIYGYVPAEMVGKNFLMILPPDQWERGRISHNNIVNGDSARDFVGHWPVVRKDGQIVEIMSYNNVLVREDGARFRIAVVIDVSEERRTRRALQESEQRLTSILDSMEDAVWSMQADSYQLLYANPALETLTGYAAEDFAAEQKPFTEIVYPEDRPRFIGQLKQALNDIRVETEYRVLRRDGATRWVHSRFWGVEGKRIDGVMADVTDRKRAGEQAMQLAMERERVHILSNFVRDASHEFRTPLSVINTRLYLMEKINDPNRQAEYIVGIKEQADRILRLVESLITMSRLDSLTDLHFERLDLRRLLSAMRLSFEVSAQRQELSFTFDMPSEALYVQGEMNELLVAFNAIVDNAILYTLPGGSVDMRCYRLDNEVFVDVRDSGVGISAQELPHIFERFYRVDRSHSVRGFGLGLPIARKIVEMHRGRIDVESDPAKGSLFRLVFPSDKSGVTLSFM